MELAGESKGASFLQANTAVAPAAMQEQIFDRTNSV